MDFGWKLLIPVALANLLVTGAFVAFGWPVTALAALNWTALLALLALGATRRRVPAAQAGSGSAPAPLGPALTRRAAQ